MKICVNFETILKPIQKLILKLKVISILSEKNVKKSLLWPYKSGKNFYTKVILISEK